MGEFVTTMTVNGQITIPKEIREKFGFQPGAKVWMTSTDDYLRIRRPRGAAEMIRKMDAVRVKHKVKIPEELKGKSVGELKEIFAKSEKGKAYFKEKYGV